jgi:hypothetical protein
MITVISALLGFAGSMIPEILHLFKDKSDREHELKILQMQLEQQRIGQTTRLEEIRVEADSSQMQALYSTWRSGVRWVDAYNASVRPTLAYAFFALYATVKIMQFQAHTPWALWNEEDQAIFAGIISFYYGQRAFSKLRKG